jgi:hypothetical protein
MPDLPTDATQPYEHDSLRQEATIEPNGSEFLVTINGAVFVALSADAAKAFAQRMRATPLR